MKKEYINLLIDKYKNDKKPIMIYDLIQLEENIKSILSFESKYNLKFIFPVKSFPNEKVIKLFSKYNFGYDIANKNEYDLIKNDIDNSTYISVNGINSIDYKINSQNIIYNLNSIYDLFANKIYNGIRINTYFRRNTNFSRFGIPISELNSGVIDLEKIESLSFHFYEEVKMKKIKLICKLYKKVSLNFQSLKYINIGGNWNILNKEELEKILIYLRKNVKSNIKIIIEVGENWFNNCGYLLTKVVSENVISNKKIFYINAVKESVAKWSVLHPINISYEKKDKYVYIISGNSCYEKDVFYVSTNKINLKINDIIIFQGLNGYSYAWCKEFNGSEKPEVIFYE